MNNVTDWIVTETAGARARAVLRGAWTADAMASKQQWRRRQRALAQVPADAGWDLRQAQSFDHLGALTLWEHWNRRWPDELLAEPWQSALLQRVADLQLQPEPLRRRSPLDAINDLGRLVLDSLHQARDFIAMLGQFLLDMLGVLARPASGPWRDFSGHLYHIGARALPITALVGFLIGIVLAYLMSNVLRQFGAQVFVVNILGLALIRELGPLLGAVLVAGRSGSAITAQIGVMRVTEEIDAMRVLGIPVGLRLVLPRVAALAIAMPLIAVWTTLAALVGGTLAADLALGIPPTYFWDALPKVVRIANLWLAVGKSVVFGIAIALIGCHFGLRVQPNTESLGQGTTASVVTSITAVILIDALFAIVFRSVGLVS